MMVRISSNDSRNSREKVKKAKIMNLWIKGIIDTPYIRACIFVLGLFWNAAASSPELSLSIHCNFWKEQQADVHCYFSTTFIN